MAHDPRQFEDNEPEFHSFKGASADEHEGKEVDIALLREAAVGVAKNVITEWHEANGVSSIELLAVGGYNRVWLVTYQASQNEEGQRVVLRIPRRETPSLSPYQLRHEVGCLRFLEKHLPRIPTPRICAWNDGLSGGSPFIAEEFIDGQRLSVVWPLLTETQKTTIVREIANVVADLGETRFRAIGGFTQDGNAGPTIEAAKVFNGRAKFHSPEYYDIGPYTDSKEYILACYDREISYYTHAAATDVMAEAFENTSVADFVATLKLERLALLREEESLFRAIDAEPRVLVHEDFHAGNILVRDGHVVGVLDWEFSGVYPLSELLGPILVLQISSPGRDDLAEEEEMKWHERYLHEVESVIRERGWSNQSISTVLGDGHRVLQKARSIMFPEQQEDDGGLKDEE